MGQVQSITTKKIQTIPSKNIEKDSLARDLNFLGEEFLTWVAFSQDTTGSSFHFGRTSIDADIWIDDYLILRERGTENPSAATLRGGDPLHSSEMYSSLGSNKMIGVATIGVRKGDREWRFKLGSDLQISSLQLPTVLVEEEDEKVFERMALMEELCHVIDALLEEFSTVRFGPLWKKNVVPAIGNWISEERSKYPPLLKAESGA